MDRLLRPLGATLALLAFRGSGCGASQPSLGLVTVAGLRGDAISSDTTPELARLQQGAALSRRVITPVPDTVAAAATLMTGRDADRLGIRYGDLARLPRGAPTLAEKLRAEGYRTVAFVGQGSLSPLSGLLRGFQQSLVPVNVGDVPVLADESQRALPRAGGWISATKLADAVGGYLLDHSRRGLFIWVHLADLSLALEQGTRDPEVAYQEALVEIDEAIGYLRESLETYQMADHTVLAVVSLHGEALGEAGELRHGLSLTDSVVNVPVVVGGRGARTPGDTGQRAQNDTPFPLAGLHELLLESVGLGPAPAATPTTAFVATWWPSRDYGWPDLAAAASREGWLRLDPEPRFVPAGSPDDQAVPWESAPAELRQRLEQAGFLPSRSSEHSAAERDQVLRSMARARAAANGGDTDAALETLRHAVELAPGAIGPLRAYLLVARQAESSAPQSLLDALAEPTTSAPARVIDLARLLVEHDRDERAATLIEELSRSSLSSGERLALARLYESIGAREAAVEQIEAAEAEEDFPAPELCEWKADQLLRAGNTYRARLAYEQALESSARVSTQRSPYVLAKLGDCLASLSEHDQALQRYAEAVRIDPTYRYPHARAADVLLEQGQQEMAAHALILSLPEISDPVARALQRAQRLQQRGLLGHAASELSATLEQHPHDDALEVQLARVYLQAGQPEQARKLVSEVLARSPDATAALKLAERIESGESGSQGGRDDASAGSDR
ncbi:MAG: sulfatase-like hydrolase/transferase [Acidobacteriota bacterium]|nr:MAG: sulfatase-like hydrolase/transferase [Acidobacteriota bacterium]